VRRPRFRSILAAFAAAFVALPLAAKPNYPLELTVQGEDGKPVQDAAVEIRAAGGERFEVSGKTDRRGRYQAKLPDFARVYRFRVTKEKFAIFEQSVDFAAQNLVAGQTAELTITLPLDRGPSPEAIFNQGAEAIRRNDLATAEAKMREATRLAPGLAPAWSVLAMLAADAQRWPEALDAADRTLAIAPADAPALRARAEALAALGRRPEADAALDRLAEADRSDDTARVLFNAGAEAWSRKDAALATRRFEQALAANPALHQAHSALAEVKIGGKDLEGALAALERALELAPTAKKLWQRKADVLEALGRKDEAAAAREKLAQLEGGG
jgi:tetratricopeptide (TPR) repeat protein